MTSPDNPQIAVLLFSMHEEDDAVMEAVLAGGRGYVVKGVRQEQLLRAIRTVADGGAVFGPGIARRMIDFFSAAKQGAAASGPMAGLTDREREVLELIAKGRTNEQIAEQLVLERGTASARRIARSGWSPVDAETPVEVERWEALREIGRRAAWPRRRG